MTVTGIALFGCGYVADYYMATVKCYPNLVVRGVYDIDAKRMSIFCSHYKLKEYRSSDDLLLDPCVDIVLNLTNPRSHYEVSRRCLEAGKHVYSEKPMAMHYEDACTLVEFAKQQHLEISTAPCSVLGETARTLSDAVSRKVCGDVKLVYAELDDGLVHKMAYKKWFSESGAPWPYRDEFEVGCTLEHAGYVLAWMLEMFGPVKSLAAYSDCLIQDKIASDEALCPDDTADVSFGVLKFESGEVLRLSTTIVAPHDHSIRIIGDKGVLYVKDCWNNSSPVYYRRLMRIRRKSFLSPWKKRMPIPRRVEVKNAVRGSTKMDFLLGVQDLAHAISSGKRHMLNAEFSLHINEISLALQYAGTQASVYFPRSRFPVDPRKSLIKIQN